MTTMNKFLTILETANYYGVSTQTLRRWERQKKITPAHRTKGGQRRYSFEQISTEVAAPSSQNKPTLAYARVSTADQKEDLQRQVILLESFCSTKGWSFVLVKDIGSGMNCHKKGLTHLLDEITKGSIERLVLTHKDRLLRFGAELIFSLCAQKKIEVVVINQGEEISFEEELAKDVLEIITVFSSKLYGSRSHKNKELMAKLQEVVADV